MSDVAAPLSASDQRTMLDAARVWWLFLITGTAWLLFSIIVFRFDYTTVSAIAIVFGILMLGFALMEVVSLLTTHGWRRLLHAVLALAFVVIAIVELHPSRQHVQGARRGDELLLHPQGHVRPDHRRSPRGRRTTSGGSG